LDSYDKTGTLIVTGEKSSGGRYYSDGSWIDLDSFRSMFPYRIISQPRILTSQEAVRYGNKKTGDVAIKPGVPFILIQDNN